MSDEKDDNIPAKAAKVNWPERLGPKKVSYKHDFIIRLAALGFKQCEIAERTGYSQTRLSLILNNSRIKKKILQVREQVFSKDPDTALRTMIPDALNVIREVIQNPQERAQTRIDASYRLLDRTHGKAKQSIDVGGSLIRDLFDQLDAVKNAKPIDVTVEAKDADVIDAWVSKEYDDGKEKV